MADYKLNYTGQEIDNKLGVIENLAKKEEVPSTTSQLVNDAGFVTNKELSEKKFITIDIDS